MVSARASFHHQRIWAKGCLFIPEKLEVLRFHLVTVYSGQTVRFKVGFNKMEKVIKFGKENGGKNYENNRPVFCLDICNTIDHQTIKRTGHFIRYTSPTHISHIVAVSLGKTQHTCL